jgi:hypothetical protein
MEENFIDKYDDSEAVAFILNYLPMELKEKFTEDDIYYIMDVSEEYYEQSNFFETDDDTEERELIEYIIREAAKDEVGKFTPEDILFVLQGEEAYFESIYGDMGEEL